MTPAFSSPDYRNLGIQLRILVIVQVMALAAGVIKGPDAAGVLILFADFSVHIEPPLLFILVSLYILSPRLAELPNPMAMAAPAMLSMIYCVLWESAMQRVFPEHFDTGPLRAMILSGGATVCVLLWLDWRARRLSPALAEARLQALQARIRPHFLFNSLNSVLSLIRSAPAKAETALEDLAELYRVLMAENRELSTLSREIELTRSYQGLEALRLGERLLVTWRTANAPLDARLPALILQPLLENAIYHGVEPHADGGEVSIDIFARDHQLHIVVRNPVRSDAPARQGNRMALSNIRERLALHFDAEARLSTHQAGGEFVVQVVMPLVLPHPEEDIDGEENA
jgi:two-component system sensor histidine kinase AlgZ